MKSFKMTFLVIFVLITKITFGQIAGSVDKTFNTSDIGYGIGDGPNTTIRSIIRQSDDKIIIMGDVTKYNNTVIKHILRINTDGTVDSTFDFIEGTDITIRDSKVLSNGNILIAGDFSTVGTVAVNKIALLNPDGVLETGFNTGQGANNHIFKMAVQSDGKIIVVGIFTQYDGNAVGRLARLNVDGSYDNTFNTGLGADDQINDVVIQSDGKIILVGNFTKFNNLSHNKIVRLNTDGTIDNSFSSGLGFDKNVNTILIQSDLKLLVGGEFTTYDNNNVNYIIRLDENGVYDNTFSTLARVGLADNGRCRVFSGAVG